MTEEEIDALYALATEKWGRGPQIGVSIEECGEYVAAICKWCRGRGSDEPVIDEIADVAIMMDQMANLFGREKVQERIAFKLNRLKERLANA